MRKQVLGCAVDDLTLDQMVDRVEVLLATNAPHYNVSINVHKVVEADRDQRVKEVIENGSLNNADGMPVVWASRMVGAPIRQRVAGIDLFEALVARAAAKGWNVYLLGARPEVVSRVKELLCARHPALRIVGARDGYWKPADEARVVEEVARTNADLLFIGFGSPRKELFIGRHLAALNVRFAMGVGGSFDVLAGVTRRAPRWMQRTGLEWFYRFLQEPKRMGPRYFGEDLRFFAILVRALMQRRLAGSEK